MSDKRVESMQIDLDELISLRQQLADEQTMFANLEIVFKQSIDNENALTQQLAECQAKLDSVMLECCPEDMTPEQIATWEKHQVVAKELE